MKQQTLAMAADQGQGFEQYRKPTRRDTFLATMEEIVPWAALCEVIEPHYPKADNGRPPVGLERMLRMYFVQHWFNLADEACEEALLDSTALRRFVGIDLGRERVEHVFAVIKRLWGFAKVRYRGLSKNATRSFMALGLAKRASRRGTLGIHFTTPHGAPMPKINLSATAASLPQAWRSTILGQAGGANFKLLRMDAAAYPDECHDFDEALLVLDGRMNLEIGNEVIAVEAGELFIVPAGTAHAVAAGSHGTLVIIDR